MIRILWRSVLDRSLVFPSQNRKFDRISSPQCLTAKLRPFRFDIESLSLRFSTNERRRVTRNLASSNSGGGSSSSSSKTVISQTLAFIYLVLEELYSS